MSRLRAYITEYLGRLFNYMSRPRAYITEYLGRLFNYMSRPRGYITEYLGRLFNYNAVTMQNAEYYMYNTTVTSHSR